MRQSSAALLCGGEGTRKRERTRAVHNAERRHGGRGATRPTITGGGGRCEGEAAFVPGAAVGNVMRGRESASGDVQLIRLMQAVGELAMDKMIFCTSS